MNEGSAGLLDDDDGDYKARAGALSVLFVAGAMDREYILDLLERALSGGVLLSIEAGFASSEGFNDYDHEDEDEEGEKLDPDDEDDDYEVEDDEEEYLEGSSLALAPAPNRIGPNTPMRTSAKGEHFIFVVSILERWLQNCPSGPLRLGLESAMAVTSLVCNWSATVTHALTREPQTLAELDLAVDILDYSVLEEHVEAMESCGQVEALPGKGKPRYALTEWGREAIAPLCAAIRFELHYQEGDTLPPDILDVEAAYQMALPLLKLPPDLFGSCRLGVQIPGEESLMAGATAQVDRGCVLSSSPLLEEEPENWATGSPLDWLDTVVDPSTDLVQIGGDAHLVNTLIESLHETLFVVPVT
jgi:DNA-binding HxlR family transcriptional regulator